RVVVADELVDDRAADRDGVPKALVALDELLDRDAATMDHAALAQGVIELGVVVAAVGRGRSGGVARLDDQRVADPRREFLDLRRVARADRLRARDPGFAQDFFHRRLVAAQEGGLDAGARDPAGLADLGGTHHVGLDRGLEPIDADLALHEADGSLDLLDAGHVVDLLVVAQPVAHLVVEILLGPLADPGDPRADGMQGASELPLVSRETGLQEDHVDGHGGLRGRQWTLAGQPPAAKTYRLGAPAEAR